LNWFVVDVLWRPKSGVLSMAWLFCLLFWIDPKRSIFACWIDFSF
jgi:hypothetical protein